ncbi:DUF86 domain-containing protein [Jeotgalibacillus soli]|uniref:DUF86 domain-containing protein n=1 Tax=Jeotgalibacillus soli TaxID=889306 RepID=A0A0C2QX36_9BACL|nr:DUF86 domain-containing protein [Jeotgalibacillus soli]KIL42635.1 hypothetical protein KP78_38580 [Jeotgalibacillus soli]
MYFVDREMIEQTLKYMEKQLDFLKNQSSWTSHAHQLVLERLGHVTIEAILDVGNAMIDGFIMRDPGSYEDIIDILDDEKVITKEMIEPLKKVVECRKSLVQNYTSIDHEYIQRIFMSALPTLEKFPEVVRDFLQNELGPVSAFKN